MNIGTREKQGRFEPCQPIKTDEMSVEDYMRAAIQAIRSKVPDEILHITLKERPDYWNVTQIQIHTCRTVATPPLLFDSHDVKRLGSLEDIVSLFNKMAYE